jgi:hypothetical protein
VYSFNHHAAPHTPLPTRHVPVDVQKGCAYRRSGFVKPTRVKDQSLVNEKVVRPAALSCWVFQLWRAITLPDQHRTNGPRAFLVGPIWHGAVQNAMDFAKDDCARLK